MDKKQNDAASWIEESQGAPRESIRQTKKLAEQAELLIANKRVRCTRERTE